MIIIIELQLVHHTSHITHHNQTAATKSAKLNKIAEIIRSCSVIFEVQLEKNGMILPGIFINKGTTDSTVPVAAKLQCWTFFLYFQGSC